MPACILRLFWLHYACLTIDSSIIITVYLQIGLWEIVEDIRLLNVPKKTYLSQWHIIPNQSKWSEYIHLTCTANEAQVYKSCHHAC